MPMSVLVLGIIVILEEKGCCVGSINLYALVAKIISLNGNLVLYELYKNGYQFSVFSGFSNIPTLVLYEGF